MPLSRMQRVIIGEFNKWLDNEDQNERNGHEWFEGLTQRQKNVEYLRYINAIALPQATRDKDEKSFAHTKSIQFETDVIQAKTDWTL